MKTPTPDRASRRNPREHSTQTTPVRAAQRAARAAARTAGRAPSVAARTPLSAVRAQGRAIRDIARYWRAERTTLRQGMVALLISSIGNIPTGLALGFMSGRLELLPGLFILIPAAIGMRGAIFGALASRLGTSIHAGLFRVTRDPGGVLAQNVYAATLLTFTSSLFLGVMARAVTATTGLASISVWDFVAISVVAGIASSAFVLLATVGLAALSSRRGWDLDSVAAPLVTFTGDLITLPTLFAASYLAGRGATTLVVGTVSAAACLWAGWQALRTRLPAARRILRESALTLALAGIVNTVAGTVIEHRLDRFVLLPALLVMMPSFLENAGALGGIVSSRLASRLHLGAIRPRWIPQRLAALDISLAGPWALLNFGLTGITAHFVAVALGFDSPGLGMMTALALVAGALATIGAAVIAYAVAVATFRFNLDPDNHGIPSVTALMDLIGAVCVVGTVVLLGVG